MSSGQQSPERCVLSLGFQEARVVLDYEVTFAWRP